MAPASLADVKLVMGRRQTAQLLLYVGRWVGGASTLICTAYEFGPIRNLFTKAVGSTVKRAKATAGFARGQPRFGSGRNRLQTAVTSDVRVPREYAEFKDAS